MEPYGDDKFNSPIANRMKDRVDAIHNVREVGYKTLNNDQWKGYQDY